MRAYRILIVEDEVLIADTIKRYLQKDGYQVVGTAISFEEAQDLYQRQQPDLTLVDIRLSGKRTGIDLGHFIHQHPQATPFIYLTSQMDSRNLNLAKTTFPAGYLSKPVNKEQLVATIELALHRYQIQKHAVSTVQTLSLIDGKRHATVAIRDIMYMQAQHVYVKVQLKNQVILHRGSLSDLLERSPGNCLVQVHRSFAVNLQNVSRWDPYNLYVEDFPIPMSRSRRKTVLSLLTQN